MKEQICKLCNKSTKLDKFSDQIGLTIPCVMCELVFGRVYLEDDICYDCLIKIRNAVYCAFKENSKGGSGKQFGCS